MNYLFLLLAAVIVVTAGQSACEYVALNRVLNNVKQVEECFNTYTLSQDTIDAVLLNLASIGEIYPYVDVARNPPNDPPGYFKVMDYKSGLEKLNKSLSESGGVISKVVRPVKLFVSGFRDGHFNLDIGEGPSSPNIFAKVFALLPFEVFVEDNGGNRRVFISLNQWTEYYLPMKSYGIYSKFKKGIYVTKVDGKDALTFFAEFFGGYSDQKSQQGRFFNSIRTLNNGFLLMDYPLDNIFEMFSLTYSDGDTLEFSFGFLNNNGYFRSSRDSEVMTPEPKHFINILSLERNLEIRDFLEHFDEHKRPTNRGLVGKDLQCGMIGNMNYLTVPTFAPDNEKDFVFTLFDCIDFFDNNDKPITVILKQNGGGNDDLVKLIQFLLMPESDVRSLEAVRKTNLTESIIRNVYNHYFSNISNSCQVLSSEDIEVLFSQEDHDDLGNGVVHTRTKKMFVTSKDLLQRFERFSLKKNARKPTDIIVATDGYCFSACSEFVDNCITSGSAIVTGFGVSMPGDEKFVAGQCPSLVFSLDINALFKVINENYGIFARSTLSESYIISEDMEEKIPLDYSILRVDSHCGYNNSFDPDIAELLKHTTAVYEEFKTKCNPDNQRLLLVDDKCQVDDPNALHAGYACGSNGEWNKTQCKISSCKTGYVVDFKTNKCVPNCCDPRIPKYPSSSSSEESDSSSVATTVYPLTAICSALLILMAKLAFVH